MEPLEVLGLLGVSSSEFGCALMLEPQKVETVFG